MTALAGVQRPYSVTAIVALVASVFIPVLGIVLGNRPD